MNESEALIYKSNACLSSNVIEALEALVNNKVGSCEVCMSVHVYPDGESVVSPYTLQFGLSRKLFLKC